MARKTSAKPLLAALLTFFLLEGAALILMAKDSIVQQVRIEGFLASVQEKLYSAGSGIGYYFNLKSINKQLSAENNRLMNQLSYYRTVAERTDSSLLMRSEAGDSSGFSYIPARIIGNSTNKMHNYIIINRGLKAGVREDMGVVSPEGVVGVVRSVSENYAYVISLLNINQTVSAKILSSGVYGPLTWDGHSDRYAVLSEIPQHIPVNVGDSVVTSGLSSIFPPDIPLGTIRKSKIVMGSHHEIQVKLFQDFRKLYFVTVVVNNNKEEIDNLRQKYEE